jgi:hypothetical protein
MFDFPSVRASDTQQSERRTVGLSEHPTMYCQPQGWQVGSKVVDLDLDLGSISHSAQGVIVAALALRSDSRGKVLGPEKMEPISSGVPLNGHLTHKPKCGEVAGPRIQQGSEEVTADASDHSTRLQ